MGQVSLASPDSYPDESAQVEVAVQKEEHHRGKVRLQALRKDLSARTRQLKQLKLELKQPDLSAARQRELQNQAAKLAAKVEQLCEAEEAAVQRAEKRLQDVLPASSRSTPGMEVAGSGPRRKQAVAALNQRDRDEERRQEMIRKGVITPFQTLADVPKQSADLFGDCSALDEAPAADVSARVDKGRRSKRPAAEQQGATSVQPPINMPTGWTSKHSASTGRQYYVSPEGRTQWHPPDTTESHQPNDGPATDATPVHDWNCRRCTFSNEASSWPVCRMCWHNFSEQEPAAKKERPTSRRLSVPRAKRKRKVRKPASSGSDATDGSDLSSDGASENEGTAEVMDDGDEEFFNARLASLESTRAEWQQFSEVCDGCRIPTLLYDKLFEYQRTGVRWLWQLHDQGFGGVVGDEMGLGKTITMIAFFSALHSARQFGCSIVACPATILGQWVSEFRVWFPWMRVAIVHSSGAAMANGVSLNSLIDSMARCKTGAVMITTYEMLRSNAETLDLYEWQYVVLDEGHKIRNPDAGVTLAAKALRSNHRLILSGSPLQNNLKELWSLFDFVYPGLLGTLPVFQTEFVLPIAVGGYTTATEVQLHTAYQCAKKLRDLVAPYLLRRMKCDVGDQLPDKKEQVLFCKLTRYQRHAYKQVLDSHTVSAAASGEVKPFAAITMMRKVCNHPELAGLMGDQLPEEEMMERETFWQQSGKLVVLLQLLEAWEQQGHRALIFTQTRTVLSLLERMCKQKGYSYFRMDGMTAIKARSRMIEAFNRPSGPFLFLLTNRVGGLGINLIGANRVLLFEPDWNPASDMQAKERAWRLGQQKEVAVYMLITAGCIEEKIYHRQLFKQFLANKVLKDPTQSRFFKSNDLQDLFTLAPESALPTETGAIFRHAQVAADELKPAPAEGEGDSAPAPDLLSQLLESSGLHSVLSHDAIMQDDCTKQEHRSLAADEAQRVADHAVAALARSSELVSASGSNVTWTGNSGNAGAPVAKKKKRFGTKVNPAVGLAALVNPERSIESILEPVAVAPAKRKSGPWAALPAAPPSRGTSEGFFGADKHKQRSQPTSSQQLLDEGTGSATKEATMARIMAVAIRDTLAEAGGSAASSSIVGRFKDRFSGHEALFKAVLKKVAQLEEPEEGGPRKWRLKDAYQ